MPSLVQTASNHISTTTSSVTVTLGANVKAGDGVVVAIAGTSNGTTYTVTGGSDTFTKAVIDGFDATSVYYVLSSGGGYTTVTVGNNATGNGIAAWVYEVSPLKALDTANSGTASGSGSPWTSNSATGNFASEFVAGAGQSAWGSGPSITGPGAPWTNGTSFIIDAPGSVAAVLSGYQITTSTGSYTYSGTGSGTSDVGNSASVAVFQFAPSLSAQQVIVRQAVKRAAYY